MILGIAATAAIAGLMVYLHVRRIRAPRAGTWAKAPRVYVYDGFELTPVRIALGRWAAVGHEHHHLRRRYGPVVDHPGCIVITRDRGQLAPTEKGRTRLTLDGRTIKSATISLAADLEPSRFDLVLTHELGHAFGLLHMVAGPDGNIMNPADSGRVGWTFEGVDR